MGAQEERYWHAFNQFQLRLHEHMDERDALAHRWVGGWGVGGVG